MRKINLFIFDIPLSFFISKISVKRKLAIWKSVISKVLSEHEQTPLFSEKKLFFRMNSQIEIFEPFASLRP